MKEHDAALAQVEALKAQLAEVQENARKMIRLGTADAWTQADEARQQADALLRERDERAAHHAPALRATSSARMRCARQLAELVRLRQRVAELEAACALKDDALRADMTGPGCVAGALREQFERALAATAPEQSGATP